MFAAISIAHTLYSQDQHAIDSLRGVIKKSHGVDKYNAWHNLVVEYIDVDNRKALSLVTQAEAVALATSDSAAILKSKRLKGQILYRLGKLQAVVSLLKPVLACSYLQRMGDEYLAVANLLGVCHMMISQFDRGLEYFFMTMDHAKRQQNSYYLSVAAGNIGITYYKLKDYRKALPFMISGYQIQDSLGILRLGSAVNVSLCYSNLEKYDRALRFLQKSISLCGDECNAQDLTHIKYASGYIFYRLKQYNKAEDEFLASLESSRQANDHRMELDNIYLLAKISMERNDLRKAEHYLNAGDYLIQKKIPFNMEAIKVYGELSELYLRLRKFEQASFYQSRYIALRDSIYNESLTTNLMKVESGYLQRENEARIEAQQELIRLKEQIVNRQVVLNWLAGFVVVTAMILLFFVYRNYRLKKNSNLILEQKIVERTHELDLRVALLLKALNEKELAITRLMSIITETTNSLKGIVSVACIDGSHHQPESFFRILDKLIIRLAKGKAIV